MQLAESLMWQQTRDQQWIVKSAQLDLHPGARVEIKKNYGFFWCGFIQALLPPLLVQKLIIENGNDWFIFCDAGGKNNFF